MSRLSKWFFYVLVFPASLGLAGWQGWQWWSWSIAPVDASSRAEARVLSNEDDSSEPSELIEIEINDGTSARQIGEELINNGLIRSATAWNLWTRWQTLQKRPGGFLAGTYLVSTDESMPTMRIEFGTVM